jgi:DNA ligase (NAD+)
MRMMSIDGLGRKTADAAIAKIIAKADALLAALVIDEPLAQRLTNLGIAAPKAAVVLAQAFGGDTPALVATALRASQQAPGEGYLDLIATPGIGEASGNALVAFFAEPHSAKAVADLTALITILPYAAPVKVASPVTGKTVVFTGTLEKLSRNEAKAQAERQGAKVASAVSKKTDYLIAGAEAGSKLDAARSLGVTVLSEDEWISLVSGAP